MLYNNVRPFNPVDIWRLVNVSLFSLSVPCCTGLPFTWQLWYVACIKQRFWKYCGKVYFINKDIYTVLLRLSTANFIRFATDRARDITTTGRILDVVGYKQDSKHTIWHRGSMRPAFWYRFVRHKSYNEHVLIYHRIHIRILLIGCDKYGTTTRCAQIKFYLTMNVSYLLIHHSIMK